jgi:hypothetical protein
MSEPSRPEPPPAPGASSNSGTPSTPGPSTPDPAISGPSTPSRSAKYVDFFLYASAAVSYVSLAIYNKWLLDWIVGPFWLVAWVWGLPAIVKLVRRQPIRPRRGPVRDSARDTE